MSGDKDRDRLRGLYYQIIATYPELTEQAKQVLRDVLDGWS
jgi:hypothetical protein